MVCVLVRASLPGQELAAAAFAAEEVRLAVALGRQRGALVDSHATDGIDCHEASF
jgi:hypothetical protein